MAAASARTAQEGASVAKGVLDSFAADLFVLRGSTKPTKKNPGIGWEFHANPLGLGALAVGGGLALWLMQLRMHPQKVKTYKTVVDTPAWIETIPHAGSGHYEPNAVAYGEPVRMWMPGSWVRGTYKPGYWYWYQPMQTTTGQHWVVDLEEYVETVSHPAVTHQEETGETKKFSIEQRRGFLGNGIGTDVGETVGVVGRLLLGPWSWFVK